MLNWLSHVIEPSTNAIFETSMVVPLSQGVDDAAITGAMGGRGQKKSLFLPGRAMLVPPGAVMSVVGGSSPACATGHAPPPPPVPPVSPVDDWPSDPPQPARTNMQAAARANVRR